MKIFFLKCILPTKTSKMVKWSVPVINGLFFFLFLFGEYSVHGQVQDFMKTIDPYITGPHAKMVKDILSNPEQVICYRLAETDDIDIKTGDTEKLDIYWIRTNISKKLNEEEREILFSNLLHNEVNYQKEMALMSSPYVPVVDFQLIHKGKSIDVLVSLSDKSWTIIYDGIRVFNNRYNNGFDFGEFINQIIPLDYPVN